MEKWNGTLKRILKRLCAEQPKLWDRYLPAVLFAYQEAKQASLGFSPFELLYGHTLRGPMQILKELWVNDGEQPETKTVYQYILDRKSRLKDTCKLAQEELTKVRVKWERLYDSGTRPKVKKKTKKNSADLHGNNRQDNHFGRQRGNV